MSDSNLDVPGAWPGIRFEPDMIGEGNRIDYVEGFTAIDQLPNVTVGMLRRGWPADDVRKALGENWLRVYRAAWGS